MERGWKHANHQKIKYDENTKKYGISGNMTKYAKQEENAGKNGIRPDDENELTNEVELDGEDGGATRKI